MKTWVIAAAMGVAALAAMGARVAHVSALEARLLKSLPDNIPSDPDLMSFALARGEPAFGEHCASCHGAQLRGDPLRAIPDLTDASWLYGTGRIGELERVVLYGIRAGNSKGWDLADMPAFARQQPYRRYEIATLLPQEIDDLVAYLLAFQAPAQNAAAVERGARLFVGAQKGVCWDCHGEDARGDSAIGAPDLTDALWLSGDGSAQSIHDSIAFGLAGSCPAWIDTLAPATIRSLALYVYSRQAQTKSP